jgi:hypothetical protein
VLNKHRHSINRLGLGNIIHNLVLCDRGGDIQAVKFVQTLHSTAASPASGPAPGYSALPAYAACMKSQTPVGERVWTYKAGSKIPPTGHHQTHRMKSMRLRFVDTPKATRQPQRYAIVGHVGGLAVTAQSLHHRDGRTIEARQKTARRMPPETNPRTALFHDLFRQADIVAHGPKSVKSMVTSSNLKPRPMRDAQGTRRRLIGTSLKSNIRKDENGATMLASAHQSARVAELTLVAMASARKVLSKGSV